MLSQLRQVLTASLLSRRIVPNSWHLLVNCFYYVPGVPGVLLLLLLGNKIRKEFVSFNAHFSFLQTTVLHNLHLTTDSPPFLNHVSRTTRVTQFVSQFR